jgi:hypothetical protein
VGGAWGEELDIYHIEALFRLYNGKDSALLLNPGIRFFESEAQELNAGLIYRQLLPESGLVLGINGYYDAQFTDNDNTLQQLGVGVEVLSRWVDARANYYFPLDDPKVTEIQRGGSRYRVTEETLKGYDAEVGVWLPYVSKRLAPVGVFAGYYDFSPDGDGPDVDGARLRIEARITQNLTLDGEWYDKSGGRDSEYVVGVRLSLPFDFWNGVNLRKRGQNESLRPRLLDPVVRDYRIHTLAVSTMPIVPETRPKARSEALVDKKNVEKTCRYYNELDDDGNVVLRKICE